MEMLVLSPNILNPITNMRMFGDAVVFWGNVGESEQRTVMIKVLKNPSAMLLHLLFFFFFFQLQIGCIHHLFLQHLCWLYGCRLPQLLQARFQGQQLIKMLGRVTHVRAGT